MYNSLQYMLNIGGKVTLKNNGPVSSHMLLLRIM